MILNSKFFNFIFFTISLVILSVQIIYAAPYTLCNGREFNSRIKIFMNDGDKYAREVPGVIRFEKGYNPPVEPELIADVSEDRDGSVIVYARQEVNDLSSNTEYTLYWYSDGAVTFNDDASYMFSDFTHLRSVDMSGFVYLRDLHDTRYMFANCRSLKRIEFKKTNANELNLTETQGMFFNCQSLTNIDLTFFTTYHVDNMDEMFYRCYNLKNIYVKKDRWNIESVRSFNRMFSDCYILRSNDGTKAVDIAEDDYEKYAVPGDDNKEGFLKDINYTYLDYGNKSESVPVDGERYIYVEPETIANYEIEPEEDGGSSGDIVPYVGNSSTGYGAEKEVGQPGTIYSSETSISIGESSGGLGESIIITESESNAPTENESAVESASANATDQNAETINESLAESIESSAEIETSQDINETLSESGVDTTIESAGDGRRLIEIDGETGSSDGKDTQIDIDDRNMRFIIFALGISLVVILLLIGMVLYLFKGTSKK